MPTKQELIDMMENQLPGESVTALATQPHQPPAYPTLDNLPNGEPMQAVPQSPETVYAITSAPINHPPAQFGARSHLAYCPSCRSQQLTRVEYESTMMTHIMATILCCTTCSCCLPYLFDNCKTARHFCPLCDTYLGAQVK